MVLAVSGTAGAITLIYEEGPNIGQWYGPGPVTIKLTNFDVGSLYPIGVAPTGYSGLPAPADGGGEAAGVAALDGVDIVSPPGALALGTYPGLDGFMEDTWGIGKITRIEDPALDAVWTTLGKGYELNVIFHSEQDIFVETQGVGPDQRIDGVGLRVDVYSNPTGSFSAVGGTALRGAGNTYPGITGGVLELSMLSLPGYINIAGVGAGLATQFESRFNPVTTTGDGEAFVELIAGTNSYAQFNTDGWAMPGPNAAALGGLGFDLTADLRLQFDTSPNLLAGTDWLVTSDDPVKGTVLLIPEPLTMMAVVLGIGGLGGYIRKRRLS